MAKVQYSSWFARLFLKSYFDNQWVIPEPLPGWLEGLIRWYERNRMEIDLDSVSIDRPVFIISLPRSGSSMLQDLMCANPNFAYATNMMDICRNSSPCAGEQLRKRFGFNIRGERFLKDSVMVDGGSPADPVATWCDIFGEDYFKASEPTASGDAVDSAIRERAHKHVKEVLWTFDDPKRRFFCKTPMLLSYADALKAIFPDAKFIHLIRDPRATANSMLKIHRICNEQLEIICKRKKRPFPEGGFIPYTRLPRMREYLETFGPDNIETTARLWNDSIDYIDSIRESMPNLHEVRYEDILEDPEEQIGQLFDFCEVERPSADNKDYTNKISKVGKVHHKNKYSHFETIEEICRERMQRYGYLG